MNRRGSGLELALGAKAVAHLVGAGFGVGGAPMSTKSEGFTFCKGRQGCYTIAIHAFVAFVHADWFVF